MKYYKNPEMTELCEHDGDPVAVIVFDAPYPTLQGADQYLARTPITAPEQQSPRAPNWCDFPDEDIDALSHIEEVMQQSPRVCGDCKHSNFDRERGYCIQQMPNYIGRVLCGHKCVFPESED